MNQQRNGIWMNLFSPSETHHRFRLPIWVFIAAISLMSVGGLSWYFGVVRPRLNAEPIRVYKPVQPTQKTTTEVTEKGETATPNGTHLGTNPDVSVEADGASSDKTSKKTATGVENGDSLNSPNETQQMSSEQDEQERLRKRKRQEEYERIVAEGEMLLNMTSRVLARHEIITEFADNFLLDLEDGVPEEELRRQIDIYFDTVMPRLVEQLKGAPPEIQREFSALLLSTVSTEMESSEEAEKLQNRMSELLRTHGIQLPD